MSGYQKVIYKVVRDKVVVVVGGGPEALLARHCIAAGAKKVYAVEICEEVYQKAKSMIGALGLQKKIVLVCGYEENIKLPAKVDYCICALAGNIGSAAGCIPVVNKVRQLLKDSACMIPGRMVTKIAAIHLADENINYRFTDSGAYYVKDIFEKAGYSFDLRIALENVSDRNLVSGADIFEDLDMTGDLPLKNEKKILLQITKDGEISGFLAWLNLYITSDSINDVLQNRQDFLPVYFPVFHPSIPVHKGDTVSADVCMETRPGSIYPDYRIQGELQSRDGVTTFSYQSPKISEKFLENDFYRRVFPHGRLQIQEPFSVQSLQEYLAGKLPEYMVPAILVELDKFPLSPNGKIDRKALMKEIEERMGKVTAYVKPRNATEETLVMMWQEILGRDKIGVKDNFFALGGHSLKATRLIERVKKVFNIKIDLRAFFLEPTIEVLADKIINDTWLQSSLQEKDDRFEEVKI